MTARISDLARQYADTAHRLHVAAHLFSQASELLAEGNLERGEAAVRAGLDALGSVVEGMPQVEEVAA